MTALRSRRCYRYKTERKSISFRFGASKIQTGTAVIPRDATFPRA